MKTSKRKINEIDSPSNVKSLLEAFVYVWPWVENYTLLDALQKKSIPFSERGSNLDPSIRKNKSGNGPHYSEAFKFIALGSALPIFVLAKEIIDVLPSFGKFSVVLEMIPASVRHLGPLIITMILARVRAHFVDRTFWRKFRTLEFTICLLEEFGLAIYLLYLRLL